MIYGFQIFSVTNNTECGKLLEEIKCALCSPHSQSLFHSPEREALERDLVLPLLCKDYCKEFFYTCRGHIPGKKKKRYNLNKLLWDILTRYLFLSACIQECKIYLIFQNTYFYLIINLLNFETCYYCLKGITVISVYTQYVGFVEMFYISCYTDNTVGNLYTRWIISTNFLLVSSLPINVNIKTGSPSLQANCRLATDC